MRPCSVAVTNSDPAEAVPAPGGADAFDAADGGDVSPSPFPHISFGAIDAEGLDADEDIAAGRLRNGQFPERELFGTAGLLDDHCFHN